MLITHLIDMFFGIALFINASLFIPQILMILKEKSVKGLSLTTFAGFNVIQASAILYGIVHSDYVMIIGYTLSLSACGTVTILIVLMREKKKTVTAEAFDCHSEN